MKRVRAKGGSEVPTLRARMLRRIFPWLASPLLGVWMGSLRIRWCHPENLRAARGANGPVIFAFWHEDLLYFSWSHRGRGVRTMVSRHRDGELIARVVEFLGFRTVRGSTTRGGSDALREMVRAAADGADLALTPDGPRGPRRALQPGILQLAADTGRPIVPAAVAYRSCRRVGSWDRTALPAPFTRGIVLFAPPFVVSREGLSTPERREVARASLEQRMRENSEDAVLHLDELYQHGARRLSEFDPQRV